MFLNTDDHQRCPQKIFRKPENLFYLLFLDLKFGFCNLNNRKTNCPQNGIREIRFQFFFLIPIKMVNFFNSVMFIVAHFIYLRPNITLDDFAVLPLLPRPFLAERLVEECSPTGDQIASQICQIASS